MVNRWAIGLLSFSLLAVIMGCTRDAAKEEMKKYNMQAYQEGNKEAKTEGSGLNGQLLNTMKDLFKDHNIRLTNDTYAEDDAGNMSYLYRMNDDSSQLITVHIFTDEQARINGIKELYGAGGLNETGTMDNMIFTQREAALVYTSAGKKKDQYTEQVKKVAADVLNQLPRRSNDKPK
ncbi:hypothetical protein SAMN05661091_2103 [Paenibacillus uliginis N3/975]|uniref:Uncharacterized protein n=1 Tax=Paenibacillus uliginis N3/975 TaxID=1313296 RepID=A0A1X7H9H8_9BACL|nr:hypothetical protein [Paenibacillus uliginis]SMF82073.1 hypothetical protein SAMN05661091_2103 [Paenibacillus uliginis N3/975]